MKEEPRFIYPFLLDHIERIFVGKDVVCKYVGRGQPSIDKGSKLLFYGSGGRFEIIGEGTIDSAEFLTPAETISKYGMRLFISQKELDEYKGVRPPERKLFVLVLRKIRKYSKPIKLGKPVTMSGQTITKETYENFEMTRNRQ
jgi:hypothetical protein